MPYQYIHEIFFPSICQPFGSSLIFELLAPWLLMNIILWNSWNILKIRRLTLQRRRKGRPVEDGFQTGTYSGLWCWCSPFWHWSTHSCFREAGAAAWSRLTMGRSSPTWIKVWSMTLWLMEIRCYIQRVLRSHIRKNSKGRETRPMSPARSRIRISWAACQRPRVPTRTARSVLWRNSTANAPLFWISSFGGCFRVCWCTGFWARLWGVSAAIWPKVAEWVILCSSDKVALKSMPRMT